MNTNATDVVQLVLSEEETLPRLHGQVVDFRGNPVPQAEIGLTTVVSRTRFGTSSQSVMLGTAQMDGTFDFKRVPVIGVTLFARVPGGDNTELETEGLSGNALEIVVSMPMSFRLDREHFRAYRYFEVHDQNGKVLALVLHTWSATSWIDRVPLRDEPTWPTYEVMDSAVELLLFHDKKDNVPALRVPLNLQRGKVTVVQ